MTEQKRDFILFEYWIVDRNEIDAVCVKDKDCILTMKSKQTFTINCTNNYEARILLANFAAKVKPNVFNYYDHPAMSEFRNARCELRNASEEMREMNKKVVSLTRQIKKLLEKIDLEPTTS